MNEQRANQQQEKIKQKQKKKKTTEKISSPFRIVSPILADSQIAQKFMWKFYEMVNIYAIGMRMNLRVILIPFFSFIQFFLTFW